MLENASNRRRAANISEALETSKQAVVAARGTYVPAESEHVDVFRLLDELTELTERAKHVRPLRLMIGFDEERYYTLLLKLRAHLPDDMKRAHRVARDSERILDNARERADEQISSARTESEQIMAQARAEAERIVAQAYQQAATLVSDSEISRQAVARGGEIVAAAENDAAEVRKGADEYARDVLAKMEAVMNRALATVRHDREQFEEARAR